MAPMMVPGMVVPMHGMMPRGPPPYGDRGGFGGRGMGGRGRGMRGHLEYFDLDDPGNARQLLDYGDI